MPSATTAESSDSIPPSSVIAIAGRIRSPRCFRSNVSGWNCGNPSGNAFSPNRAGDRRDRQIESMTTTQVPAITATIEPGTKRAQRFGQSLRIAIEPRPTTTVGRLDGRQRPNQRGHLARRIPAGTVASRSPRKSFTCDSAIVIAIPQVKPVVTGCGMNFTSVPSRAAPSDEQASRPPSPCRAADSAARIRDDRVDQADKRPGRSANLHPRSAQRRHEKAADDRRVDARARRHTGGHSQPDRQRQRDQPTVNPASTSVTNRSRE